MAPKGVAAAHIGFHTSHRPPEFAISSWGGCLTLPAVGTACLSEVPAKALDIIVAAIVLGYLIFRDSLGLSDAEWRVPI